jgi:glycosyltransferase involved in cell wall biosynthesis
VADVSLIMPVWRPHGPWLQEAVRSALDQDGVDLELVVVDDGNEVPVAELLGDLDDSRLRHVRVDHGGVSAARNAGLRAASGAFVRFVDADDVLETGSTRRLRALASAETISYEDTVLCDEQLRPRSRISSRLRGDVVVPCLLGRFDTRHVSMLFPRAVVDSAGPWDPTLRVAEDFDFVLRCLEHAEAEPGEGTATYYRRHDASATRSPEAVRDAQLARRAILTGFFARHPDLRSTPVWREAWTGIHRDEAGTALYRGELARAARSALPLVRLAPRKGLRFCLRLARRAARLSGAATARTIGRARRRPPR